MLNNTKDIIFIGKKPLMTYVTSAIIQLSAMPTITLKARGLSIGLAVYLAQLIKRKTNSFEIGTVKIDSESLKSTHGKTRNVST
ncbi:MAG: DNA-binding protein, partial [Candidatus Nitrosomaritimum aestuariumsis]